MAEYIDKSALYEKIAQLEELARNRYLETPSSSPFCSRYMTQLNERTVFKHLVADFPADDVAPARHGRWLCVDTDTEQFFLCNRCKKKEYWESDYCPNCGCRMDGGDDD